MREEQIVVNQEEERDPLTQGESISFNMSVLGFVNGMIGSAILVLPVVALTAGYITSLWVTLLVGFMAYYTANLLQIHLGKGRNIRQSILAHFNYDYKYMVAYSFCNWISFLPFLVGYFRLICLQIQGLLGYHSQWVAPLVTLTLFFIFIFLRMCHCWEQFLAYGILSIIIYIIFLGWAQVTAPAGPNSVPTSGDPFILASVMIGAFEIHMFLAQNIIKNPRRYQYHEIIRNTYIVSILVYIFIALGCFAIVNRTANVKHPQIINAYFWYGNWQIAVIQLLYLVHLVSAFPTFLIVSNIRFYEIFKAPVSRSLTLKQIIYSIILLLISLGVYLWGIDLITIFSFNGAVIGFITVFLVPIWIHFKCVWYNKSGGHIQDNQEWNRQLRPNICRCQAIYSSKITLLVQTLFLFLVLVAGLLVMWYSLSQLIHDRNKF